MLFQLLLLLLLQKLQKLEVELQKARGDASCCPECICY
jgi:hypothetical protein